MLRVSMWEELSIAVSAMGKPLVQMIEKGGLSKKMLAIDVLLRIALFAPSHRVLVASGLVEALLAPPKGIIPLALPKYTPKGKPGHLLLRRAPWRVSQRDELTLVE